MKLTWKKKDKLRMKLTWEKKKFYLTQTEYITTLLNCIDKYYDDLSNDDRVFKTHGSFLNAFRKCNRKLYKTIKSFFEEDTFHLSDDEIKEKIKYSKCFSDVELNIIKNNLEADELNKYSNKDIENIYTTLLNK